MTPLFGSLKTMLRLVDTRTRESLSKETNKRTVVKPGTEIAAYIAVEFTFSQIGPFSICFTDLQHNKVSHTNNTVWLAQGNPAQSV